MPAVTGSIQCEVTTWPAGPGVQGDRVLGMHQQRPVPGDFGSYHRPGPCGRTGSRKGRQDLSRDVHEPGVRTAQRTGRHGARPGSYVKGAGLQGRFTERSCKPFPCTAFSRDLKTGAFCQSLAELRRVEAACCSCEAVSELFPVLAVGHGATMLRGTSGPPSARSLTWSTSRIGRPAPRANSSTPVSKRNWGLLAPAAGRQCAAQPHEWGCWTQQR